MATIPVSSEAKMYKIDKFLGLNASPYGGTSLKPGELTECENFCVTPGHHLQLRPGYKTLFSLPGTFPRVKGYWTGMVAGEEVTLVTAEKKVYKLDFQNNTTIQVGDFSYSEYNNEVSFFAFGGKVYALDGEKYRSWDGSTDDPDGFKIVKPYVPVIQTATTPAGKGTLLEGPNRLTNKRIVQFSGDGKSTSYHLPEQEYTTTPTMDIISVTIKTSDGDKTVSPQSIDWGNGIVNLAEAPPVGTNNVEILYTKGEPDNTVASMRFAELYNGAADTRVFLYGDGTNRAIYSGIRYDTGKPSAEYFPDLFEMRIGDEDSPITAMCRHYSQLMVYKTDSAWSVDYDTLNLKDSSTIPAFYVHTVNRKIGNDAPGQVEVIENDPVTLSDGVLYRWRSNRYGRFSDTETNAERLSDRVQSVLDQYRGAEQLGNLRGARFFHDARSKELWIFISGYGDALILNYEVDAWYHYVFTGGPKWLFHHGRDLYGIGRSGAIMRISRDYRSDDGKPIKARAATGAMDFSRMWQLKYSPEIFVSVQPERYARVLVSAESNRRSDYPWKPVSFNWATFAHCDFRHFSFVTNRRPQVAKLRLKVKKATYYRLLFESNSDAATSTILGVAINLRFAGKVK